MILTIRVYGDDVLRRPAGTVTSFDEQLATLVQDMAETMYSAPGIGLAAPQVGVSRRIIVVDISHNDHQDQLYALINPEVVERSEENDRMEEGCLSIPGVNEAVVRPTWVKIRAQDVQGNEVEIEAEGLLARCFQHEIDHLNGILFVDRLVPFRKKLIRGKLKKLFGTISPPVAANAG
ncbi:MAG: peptide deformylase [Acidobacteria bacterium]|nr:peptide deformylase [Acidobacteriota bacterium]